MSVSDIPLFKILKGKLGEAEAQSLAEFVKSQVQDEFEAMKGVFLTRDGKVDIMRSIHLIGIVQFFAIVGSVIAIINFTHK